MAISQGIVPAAHTPGFLRIKAQWLLLDGEPVPSDFIVRVLPGEGYDHVGHNKIRIPPQAGDEVTVHTRLVDPEGEETEEIGFRVSLKYAPQRGTQPECFSRLWNSPR